MVHKRMRFWRLPSCILALIILAFRFLVLAARWTFPTSGVFGGKGYRNFKICIYCQKILMKRSSGAEEGSTQCDRKGARCCRPVHLRNVEWWLPTDTRLSANLNTVSSLFDGGFLVTRTRKSVTPPSGVRRLEVFRRRSRKTPQ